MKKVLWLLVFVYGVSFGQEKLILKPVGFDAIVTNVENKSAKEIYDKTKEWIQTYYKNPKEVLKADIPNELIRIDGFCTGGYQTKSLGIVYNMNYSYTIEIDIKEGKYKCNFIVRDLWADNQKCLYTYNSFYKSDGTERKVYALSIETMNKSANEIYLSLFNYITGKTQLKKSDW